MQEKETITPARLDPQPGQGLTGAQARERMEAGLSNRPAQDLSRSEWQIIKGNLFTFFNLLFVVLALCLVAVGAYRDIAFLGIVALNTLIGIVQEIRVKHTLDRIALLSARPATAVRDGAPVQLPADQLVLDDIVLLETGSQVCADAVVCEGKVEVNEALLTGEADAVLKKPGDTLLSGSFIVSGRCAARLEQVGDGCYAASISREAKRNKKNRSQIMRSLDSWLKVVGIAIVPLGLLMVWRQSGLDTGLTYAVSSTVAALVGMIPEGLYLLVSVALAVSVLGLARRHTLVHEMSCIENLARVDVLCLDKTGTLTAGSMRVEEVLPVGGTGQAALETALGGFAHAAESGNATATALKERFAPQGWQPQAQVAFSSQRKWSGMRLEDGSCYVLGAPEMILGEGYAEYRALTEPYLAEGKRVLVLAGGRDILAENGLAALPRPLGFVVLADVLRPDAAETLEYFRKQGVAVKVISGDNAASVARVAQLAGVEGAGRYIDLSSLPEGQDVAPLAEQYTVFGRVSPQQKRGLIAGLKAAGHSVAMVGDGVNDVLALKDADCSIAMAAGSEAAQQVAQMVLLDSQFSAVPHIVREGRRVINNIGRSASLFLFKNIFSFLVSAVLLFVALPYPLVPTQVSLVSGILIGMPSFLLTFEPVFTRSKGKFMQNALLNALPGGLAGAICLLCVAWIGEAWGLPIEQTSSVCTLLVGIVGMMVLVFLCWPLTRIRAAVLALSAVGFYGATTFFPWFFHIETLTRQSWELACAFGLAIPALMCLLQFLGSRLKAGLARRAGPAAPSPQRT